MWLAGGLNPYSYTNNNSINLVDPSGLLGEETFLGVLGRSLAKRGIVALGISQLDSPVPGPADAAGGLYLVTALTVDLGIYFLDLPQQLLLYKTKTKPGRGPKVRP